MLLVVPWGVSIESGANANGVRAADTVLSPNPAGGRTYSESQIEVLPGPEKVMSFEMPPIRLGEQQLPGHLSLRLRVDPR